MRSIVVGVQVTTLYQMVSQQYYRLRILNKYTCSGVYKEHSIKRQVHEKQIYYKQVTVSKYMFSLMDFCCQI